MKNPSSRFLITSADGPQGVVTQYTIPVLKSRRRVKPLPKGVRVLKILLNRTDINLVRAAAKCESLNPTQWVQRALQAAFEETEQMFGISRAELLRLSEQQREDLAESHRQVSLALYGAGYSDKPRD